MAYPWQTCLDIEGQDALHYLDFVNRPLLDIVAGTPRRVLELGCSGGMLGAELKQRHPGAHVVGIEPGRAAAAVAAGRIDRVIAKRLEDVDFAAEGLQPGAFDTVIAADVLEHVVNPWDVLVRVKPLLAPGAQLLASIPNVRNAMVAAELFVNGRWQYRERGLLDITHLRFFTLHEIHLMFEETGYRVEGHAATIAAPLAELYRTHKGQGVSSLEFGRLTLRDVSAAELDELCAEQWLIRARPA